MKPDGERRVSEGPLATCAAFENRVMTSNPQPAIRSVETGRADLLGFEIWGKIGKDDIERMAGVVETAFDTVDTVDIIIVMHHYDGVEFPAAFDPAGLRAQARAIRHVGKYAVVGAPGWAEAMINLMSPLSPVEARTFSLDEEDEAWAWVRTRGA
jgi:hypothetical protein